MFRNFSLNLCSKFPNTLILLHKTVQDNPVMAQIYQQQYTEIINKFENDKKSLYDKYSSFFEIKYFDTTVLKRKFEMYNDDLKSVQKKHDDEIKILGKNILLLSTEEIEKGKTTHMDPVDEMLKSQKLQISKLKIKNNYLRKYIKHLHKYSYLNKRITK